MHYTCSCCGSVISSAISNVQSSSSFETLSNCLLKYNFCRTKFSGCVCFANNVSQKPVRPSCPKFVGHLSRYSSLIFRFHHPQCPFLFPVLTAVRKTVPLRSLVTMYRACERSVGDTVSAPPSSSLLYFFC